MKANEHFFEDKQVAQASLRDRSQSVHSSSYGTEEDVLEEELPEKEEVPIAQNESKAVHNLKVLVLAVLTVSAICVALGVYFYVTNSEVDDFESSFEGDAVKVLASLGSNIDLTLGVADSFVADIMSYARGTNQSWPFVTIPDFAVRGSKSLSLSSAYILNIYPFVSNDQRSDWEQYTASHNDWVEESIDIQEQATSFTGPIIRDYENWDVIHTYEEFDKEMPGVNGTDAKGKSAFCMKCCARVKMFFFETTDKFNENDRSVSSVVAVLSCHCSGSSLQLVRLMMRYFVVC